MDWVDRPQNYNCLYGILELLQGSHLDNFPLTTLKLGSVAFLLIAFQLKLLPVLSLFCNGLWRARSFKVVPHKKMW